MSISWSRLIPNGTGEINDTAANFYNNVIDELIANGIEPFVNLFHFDMPMALQKIGGWVNRETVDAYENYARTCFRLFGGRVKKWFTHNEPIVPVEGGYLYDFHYPNKVDFKEARPGWISYDAIKCPRHSGLQGDEAGRKNRHHLKFDPIIPEKQPSGGCESRGNRRRVF